MSRFIRSRLGPVMGQLKSVTIHSPSRKSTVRKIGAFDPFAPTEYAKRAEEFALVTLDLSDQLVSSTCVEAAASWVHSDHQCSRNSTVGGCCMWRSVSRARV